VHNISLMIRDDTSSRQLYETPTESQPVLECFSAISSCGNITQINRVTSSGYKSESENFVEIAIS